MSTQQYRLKFYNTSINKDISGLDAPVVLTLNPGKMTDKDWYKLEGSIPVNLMYVRIRTNTWNLEMVDEAIEYYTERKVPVILTFMAYYRESIPEGHKDNYVFRKRTLNSYWAITTDAWEKVMDKYKYNTWVYSCGKIEGEKGNSKCTRCGNCIREFYNTMDRCQTLGERK